MAVALVLVPLLFALAALAIPSNRLRPWLVPVGGSVHLVLVLWALTQPHVSGLGGWLVVDSVARLVLALTSVLFFLCSIYARGYLALYPDRSNRIFCACMFAFIAMLTLIAEAQHLGLMWVAIETTTLSSARSFSPTRSCAVDSSPPCFSVISSPTHRAFRSHGCDRPLSSSSWATG